MSKNKESESATNEWSAPKQMKEETVTVQLYRIGNTRKLQYNATVGL